MGDSSFQDKKGEVIRHSPRPNQTVEKRGQDSEGHPGESFTRGTRFIVQIEDSSKRNVKILFWYDNSISALNRAWMKTN
jgi:hypothetical protein